jgi:hypothetical protein
MTIVAQLCNIGTILNRSFLCRQSIKSSSFIKYIEEKKASQKMQVHTMQTLVSEYFFQNFHKCSFSLAFELIHAKIRQVLRASVIVSMFVINKKCFSRLNKMENKQHNLDFCHANINFATWKTALNLYTLW